MYYFLDIDGVLNKAADWRNPFTINQECLNCFMELVTKDKAPHIILSSTWRVGMNNSGTAVSSGNVLMEALTEAGLQIEGSTPVTKKSRQEEIEYYIRRNGITEYLVLDDDESLFPNPEKLNIYFTDYLTGLTKEDVRKICKVIKKN